MGQPGMVANPACGQLDGEIHLFPYPLAPAILVTRDGFGRPVPRQLTHSLPTKLNHQSGAYSRDSSCFPRWRPSIPSTAIGSVPSFSGNAIVYRWCSPPRVRRHRASSLEDSSSNGCCLFRKPHGPISVRLFFPTPTNGTAIVSCAI